MPRRTALSRNASRLLEGVVSVLAGGGSGIGRAVVTRFAGHGAVVEFADISETAVGGTRRGAGGN